MAPKKINFLRTVIVDGYQVSLNLDESVITGHDHDLSVSVQQSDGQPTILDDYLGAPMHLAVIKDDWSQFLHTHPENDSHPHANLPIELLPRALAHGEEEAESPAIIDSTDINFHVNFPTPGFYRAFVQFRPVEFNLMKRIETTDYLLAAFWIEVKDGNQMVVKNGEETAGSRTLAGTWSGIWWKRLLVSIVAIVILSFVVRRLIRVRV